MLRKVFSAITHGLSLQSRKINEQDNENKFEESKQQLSDYENGFIKNLIEDSNLKIPQIIKKYGYPSEVHEVTTEDGYILEIHRIPHGKSGPGPNRPAVLLQHGLLVSSADWIIAGPGRGFGYILADAGYDVWMLNSRGTRYSKRHETLHSKTNAKEYWNFSWHEIAIYDIPKAVDYIIESTKQNKIFYIGYSQGTTTFYVLCSEKPEYNDKIRAMFSLAPIGFMNQVTHPVVKYASPLEPIVKGLTKALCINQFMPHSPLFYDVGNIVRRNKSLHQVLCSSHFLTVCGHGKDSMVPTLLPALVGHTPAGASTKQILHYFQGVNSGCFRQFDYGYRQNERLYGSGEPPSYNLSNIKTAVYFLYSQNDSLANPRNVTRLYKELPKSSRKGMILIKDTNFRHGDFLYGSNAPALLYSKVLKLMKKH